ncbi:DUF3048 domain-containing protein [Candidatus Saccharibacteria bacterium]|nr:DUF3048 domain-containing protein [Candidatus Saccharibacteria bacterium]
MKLKKEKKAEISTGPKHRFLRRKKIILAIILVIVIAAGTTATLIIINKKPASTTTSTVVTKKPTPKPAPAPIKYYSPLTGLEVASEAATTQAVTGVMIENSPDARPQSGLKNSGVVFEAIAEGGITRFLVLYQQEKPQLIGPVRSVRLYDVEWLAAFNASLAHVGGSYYGLQEVRNGQYRDIDQFFNSGSYWRSNDRYAPHNVYTSFARLDALNAAKGYTSSSFTGFARTEGKASLKPDASTVNINISSSLFNSQYIYNAATNNYTRYQAGAPHADREDGAITPSVVIAMFVDETSVFEDGWREQVTTIGNGRAVIFQNGVATESTWHKDSKTSQVYFTDVAGQTIQLVRGQTWIAAVPNGEGSVSWQ